MQVSVKNDAGFVPITVTITCESQAEVNTLYGIGNSSKVARDIMRRHCSYITQRDVLTNVLGALVSALRAYKE